MQKQSEYSENDSLGHILAKLSPRPVVEGLLPVAIFQYRDIIEVHGNIANAMVNFAGLGTMVHLATGEDCVITAEHLFSIHKPLNCDHLRYAVRVLHEKEGPLTRHLISASPFFSGGPSRVDIATCKVELGDGKPVHPFSSYQGGGGMNEQYNEFNIANGKPEDLILRSLVSGEEVTIFFMKRIPAVQNMDYYVVDYQSLPGESGTGFIDRYNRIFVLKGSIEVGTDNINQELRKRNIIQQDKRAFSILIGSFSIKP